MLSDWFFVRNGVCQGDMKDRLEIDLYSCLGHWLVNMVYEERGLHGLI